MHDGYDPAHRGIGRQAAGLELVVVLATVTLVAALGRPEAVERGDWIAFAVLLPLVAFAHLLGADRTKHQGSQLSLAPIFTAVLILPPSLTTLLIAFAVVPDWLRNRGDRYILVFNVCNLVAPALLARAVFEAVGEGTTAGSTVGAALALLAFLILHYGLLASVPRLARGVRASDTIRIDCVLIDAGLLSLGAIAAALWDDYPGLVALTLVPLALAYRALAIPALVEATRIEPRTGLYNLRHLEAALGQELGGAGRFDRPIALLVVDVDHHVSSTPSTARWPATGRSSRSPVPSSARLATTTSPPAAAATSSASFSPRPTSPGRFSSPSGSAAASRSRRARRA